MGLRLPRLWARQAVSCAPSGGLGMVEVFHEASRLFRRRCTVKIDLSLTWTWLFSGVHRLRQQEVDRSACCPACCASDRHVRASARLRAVRRRRRVPNEGSRGGSESGSGRLLAKCRRDFSSPDSLYGSAFGCINQTLRVV